MNGGGGWICKFHCCLNRASRARQTITFGGGFSEHIRRVCLCIISEIHHQTIRNRGEQAVVADMSLKRLRVRQR